MREKIFISFLLVWFCLNVYSCWNANSKQDYDAMDSKIIEAEELFMKYAFYKEYIIQNDVNVDKYEGILLSYIEEIEIIINDLYAHIDENMNDQQFTKLNLLIEILLKESSELQNCK